MLGAIYGLVVAMAIGLSASAAMLSVESDKSTYNVGETITLTVRGDDEGATSNYIFGSLLYNGGLVDNGSRTQLTLVGNYGDWNAGFLAARDTNADSPTSAYSWAFNQFPNPFALGYDFNVGDTALNLPDANPLATITLIARAAGIVDVSWDTGTYESFIFFGLNSAPGTSFTIIGGGGPDPGGGSGGDPGPPIPEPGTAALLGLGLVALGATRRPRRVR